MKPSTPISTIVKNTSDGLKVLRPSMITWPRPYPTPVASATSTTIQAPNRLNRRKTKSCGRMAGIDHPGIDLPLGRAHRARHIDEVAVDAVNLRDRRQDHVEQQGDHDHEDRR